MTDLTQTLAQLSSKFSKQFEAITKSSSTYSETEVRVEFIDLFFKAFGWDMANESSTPNSIKDVIREESQPIEKSTKRPDYTFRIEGQRRFFVEAKKPSVDIRRHQDSAFQARRYGWSAGLPISILTNFRTLRIYDARSAPTSGDHADVGLLLELDYLEYASKASELEKLLSRTAVVAGSIEQKFGTVTESAQQVNEVFLSRLNQWRLKLASDIWSRDSSLGLDGLNDIVQRVLNRLVFIRMCEDRGIEGENRLRSVAQSQDFVQVRRLFRDMDERYDTGLFAISGDPIQTRIVIDTSLLLEIVEDLYFPRAPYSFSVLDADFLGQTYELFLREKIALDPGSSAQLCLVEKPAYQDREVITTPQPLVDEVVRRTFETFLEPLREDRPVDFNRLRNVKTIDIAVGSGRFLLRCFDQLIDEATAWYSAIGDKSALYERISGEYHLLFSKKKELLVNCLFGIDIDYNAVETSRFSLIVKLLEEENGNTLPPGQRILPNLDSNIVWGNSVVSSDYAGLSSDELVVTHPFDWATALRPQSFSIVVGNPPYVKTEEMKVKTPSELEYYKTHYETPHKQFDKYFVFIEQAIKKLSANGCVGMVVPIKWMTIGAGQKLRRKLTAEGLVAEIVDFGNVQVFPNRSTYVCLLVLSKTQTDKVYYRHVDSYQEWLASPRGKGVALDQKIIADFRGSSWVLPGNEREAHVLDALYVNSIALGSIANVFNGVQTSAENIFAIHQWRVRPDGLIEFDKQGRTWAVEQSLTKPYLMDSSKRVWSFMSVKADTLLIFPYEINEQGAAVLIEPAIMRSQYPGAWTYLSAFRQRLQEKDTRPQPATPEHFYQYGRHQSLSQAFASPKIIASVNQLGDKYGLDSDGVGIASGGTAGEIAVSTPSLGYSLEFILGLLHQPAIELFCRKRGSPFRGGYYSRGTAVLQAVPVPKLDFTKVDNKTFHDAVVREVKNLFGLRLTLEQATGREREAAESGFKQGEARLRHLFDSHWELGGMQSRLVLPGTGL